MQADTLTSLPLTAPTAAPAPVVDAPGQTSGRPGRWRNWLVAAAIAVCVFAVQWTIIPSRLPAFVDAIQYIDASRSLAQGKGYRLGIIEGTPPASLYPPAASLLLAPAWAIEPRWPQVQVWIKGQMVTIFAVSMALLFGILVECGIWLPLAVLATVSIGTCGTSIAWVSFYGSDILFCVLCYALAWLWIRPAAGRFTSRMASTGILLAIAYLTRTATIGLLPGAFLAAAVACHRRRDWRPFLFFTAPIVLAISCWWAFPKDGTGYASWFARECGGYNYHAQIVRYLSGEPVVNLFCELFPSGIKCMFLHNPPLTKYGIATFQAICVAGLAVCAYGAWKSSKHRAIQAAVAGYLILLLLWPFPLNERALLPLAPLLILWFAAGVEALPTIARRLGILAGVGLIISGTILNLASIPEYRSIKQGEMRSAIEAEKVGGWIASKVPKGARIAANFQLPLLDIFEKSRHPMILVENLVEAMSGSAPPDFDFAILNVAIANDLQAIINAGGPKAEHMARMARIAFQAEGSCYAVVRILKAKTL